ncbi:MAG TPA: hypothetical protein VK988_19620 [Acidimicrobiales bacterium]|nr:hypothetical protein [Acidimicrobiales bacterium]
MSSTAGLILAASVALSAVALVIARPGRGNHDEVPRTAVSSDPYAPILPGLCSAQAAARSGDVAAASRIFTDTVHGPLHDVAEEAAASDRAAAARLLKAKQAVELGLERSGTDPVTLGSQLARLSATTRDALLATGHPVGPGCER